MRVIHLSKVTGIAGSEGHLLRLLPGLKQSGIDARMLILEDSRYPVKPFCDLMSDQGIPCEVIPIRFHLDPTLPQRLVNRFKDIKPDIVHTHLIHADFYGLPAASRAGVPSKLSSRHNNDAFRHNPLVKGINRQIMRHADGVITISHALGRFVKDVEQFAPEHIHTIHYGLEVPTSGGEQAQIRQRFDIPDEKRIVGFFGRLVEQKGVDVLIRAFAEVYQSYPDALLLIVGDGVLRGELETLAEQHLPSEAIKFAGWVDAASEIMPACEMIVVPSRWEGFGLVTLEAMGYSRPLIVSATSALPEIVLDGETGLHVPPEDVDSLRDAICDLLENPEKTVQFGEAGRRRLENEFSIEKMVRETVSVYKLLVKG